MPKHKEQTISTVYQQASHHMIDPQTLARLSTRMEIDAFSIMREYIQIRFLQELYKHPGVSKLYFKGGTSLRLIYQSTRFSEDLDFTSMQPVNNIKRIFQKVIVTLAHEFPSLTIKDIKTIQGYSAKISVSTPLARQELSIKLDVSERESVIDPTVSPITTSLPVASVVPIDHLSAREVVAEKIRAVLNRKKGRDIYDIWFLLHIHTPIDLVLIKKKLAYYKEIFNKNHLEDRIRSWEEKELDQDIRKFIPVSERRIIPQLKRLLLSELKTIPNTG